MKQRDHVRRSFRRVLNAEATCNATILRAFDRLLRVLERERTEHLIRLDRAKKRKAKFDVE